MATYVFVRAAARCVNEAAAGAVVEAVRALGDAAGASQLAAVKLLAARIQLAARAHMQGGSEA